MNKLFSMYVGSVVKSTSDQEAIFSFRCETPLSEMDTCDMLSSYFGEIFYEESESDSFSEKDGFFEMTGVIRLISLHREDEITDGNTVMIPISQSLTDALNAGRYDPHAPLDAAKMVDKWLGEFFDQDGNLAMNESQHRQ